MTDPTTLSLADLAAAVVRLGAHRGDDTLVSGDCDSGSIWIWQDIDEDACSLLLAAANRLPAVVAECERLTAHVATLETALLALVGPRTISIATYTPEETP